MPICPFAELRLLPDNHTQPLLTATQFIVHSMSSPGATPEDLIRYWSQPATPIEAHFIVGRDGKVLQLIDTARQADANYKANVRAISVETEDNVGHPDVLSWTRAQLAALVRVGLWSASVHPIPRRRCPDWDAAGFGTHTMWGAPSPWTPVRKTCPGKVRIRQFDEVVLPAIVAGMPLEEELSMADIQADIQAVLAALAEVRKEQAALRKDLTVQGTTGLEQTIEADATRSRQAVQQTSAILARLDTLEGKVDQLLGREPVELELHEGSIPFPTLRGTVVLEPVEPAAAGA